MWNYVRLRSENSPMGEILSKCSDKRNLRLVIYHLSENHVECATVSPNEVRQFDLGQVAHAIQADAHNGSHAVLAYDLGGNNVYLIDSTPELPVASAVLLCVVTELLNGCVQPRQCECGRPEVKIQRGTVCNERYANDHVVRRDECGRFVRAEKPSKCTCENNEPWKTPPTTESADGVMNRRFRLGRH